ncbi:TonB-dependent receptor [Calditrichota bacterium GD2]
MRFNLILKLLISQFTIFFLLLNFSVAFAGPQPTGRVIGKIVDKETGDPIVGANVYLENTVLGAASDLEGNFLIDRVPAGNYTLIVSVIGYAETRINNLKVTPETVARVNVILQPEVLTTDVIEVEAKAVTNTEASLLKIREKSIAISDAISSEAISQAGSGNAAEALKQVTGASVGDDNNIFIRGLGDRYISTWLNGAGLPSSDPYKKTASIDLIPSNLVDNIITLKSFTPDKPGDFSGGAVNIKTKDFPGSFQFYSSFSLAFNPQVTHGSSALGFNVGRMGWLGMNDGTLDLPDVFKDQNLKIPSIAEANQDETGALARQIEDLTRSFNRELGPTAFTPPMNRSFSFSLGNQVRLFSRPLGYLASFTYNRSYSGYSDGVFRRWNQGTQDVMTTVFDLKENKTEQNILWGGLLNFSYKLTDNQVISFNGIYNKNGEIIARTLAGSYPYDMDESRIFQARVLNFKERTLINGQIKGAHYVPQFFNSRIEWVFSAGKTIEDQPDQRYFNSYYDTKKQSFGIKDNTPPSRYFRYLDEDQNQFFIDFKLPFKQWSGLKSSFKTGFYHLQKDRNYSERLFQMVDHQGYNYDGDPNDLLNDENIGIVDTLITTIRGVEYRSYDWGIVVQESTLPGNNYSANQKINASYLMVELPLYDKLRFIGGVRYEVTDMNLVTNDSTAKKGEIKTKDWLHSVNFIYSLMPRMNLRVSYSRTLARPTFREIGPFATFDFMGGDVFIGNPDLKRSTIDNIDLRWEWFMNPGEVLALSAFYKNFKDPIERVFNSFEENTWKNVDFARAYGVELEVRKNMSILSKHLKYLLLGANVSFIKSRVNISEEELALIHNLRPDADDHRPFQGQSPYLINLNVTYSNPQMGLSTTVYYNIFGDRLSKVSYGGTPDVYEKSAGLLNISAKMRLFNQLSLKISGKNLLNPTFEKYQEFKGKKYIYNQFKRGRVFSVGLSYSI